MFEPPERKNPSRPKDGNNRTRTGKPERPAPTKGPEQPRTGKQTGTAAHKQNRLQLCRHQKNRIQMDSVFPSLSPEKHYICEVNDKPHINMEHNILIPLLLTLGAGLATGIGSAIAFFARRTNKRLLSFSLGLSGGVMIYVSFVELLGQAEAALAASWSARTAQGLAVAAFFAGILLIGIIDRLVPSFENPHEARTVEEMDRKPKNTRLMRMGVMTALAITIHNFPEGIATFTTALENRTLGVAIAAAVAIHNIPEGIAVSIPIFYATGNRGKAFRYSLLSGLAEPLGALLAWLVLTPFMSPTLMGCVLAGVAGIMVFISIDELLPAAREYGEAHVAIYGVVSGMAVMAASLLLLA